MRDMDDHILGGVASGIAAYFGCDVVAMRLLLIILLILPIPVPVTLIYIILWMVAPAAKTAADKLIMRGESVNLENLGKSVTDNFDNANSGKPRTTLQRIGDFIVTLVGILLKIGIFLLAVILLPVLLITIVVLLIIVGALIVGGVDSSIFGSHDMILFRQLPGYVLIMGSVAGILLVGLPLGALTYALFGSFIKLNPVSTKMKWILLGLWIIALIISIITGYAIIRANACFNYMGASLFDVWPLAIG
jgi:phage shock protein PspC (stress-responsive transcriptional regulator)